MSECDPFSDGDNPPLGQRSSASDFEVWEALEGLKEMIYDVFTTQPRSGFTGDQFYHAAFGLIVEEDEMMASTGYEYEGELVELVDEEEDGREAYVILKDVCCFISPPGNYEPEDRERFFRDTLFIARHTVMQIPLSQFSSLLLSVSSKSEIEAEFAKYRSPADLLASDPTQTSK